MHQYRERETAELEKGKGKPVIAALRSWGKIEGIGHRQ